MKPSYEDIIGAVVVMKSEHHLRTINQVVCDQIKTISSFKNSYMKPLFRIGQSVLFSGRRGTKKGTIESMGPKKAVVKVGEFESWRVPYSMLTETK